MFKSPFKTDLYQTAYELGVHYLELMKNNIQNPAVMFDIDDTLLYVPEYGGELKPIVPIIRLLNYCLNNSITVIIITARDSKTLKETKNDLDKWNINYNYLYLRQANKDDPFYFKDKVKKEFSKKYNILMSIGDHYQDIYGEYSGYSIKLPNKTDPRLFHINTLGQLENIIP